MISAETINTLIFPKKSKKPICFINIKSENNTKNTIRIQLKRKRPQISTLGLLPKRVSDLQKKYTEILSKSTKKLHSRPTITSDVSASIGAFEQDYAIFDDDLEPVQSPAEVGPIRSHLYSPLWSPQFPSPDGKGLSDLLIEGKSRQLVINFSNGRVFADTE
jgi:hypothetical protein